MFGFEFVARCRRSRGVPLSEIHLGGMNGGEVRACASLGYLDTPGRLTTPVI